MKDIIWILSQKKENIDYTDLMSKILNKQDINLKDFEISQVDNIVLTFKDEIIDYLLEHGFNSLVSTIPVLEQLVVKGTTDNKIIHLVQTYLDKLNIDNELIIVDPYFFSKTKNVNYISVLDQILDKYIPLIDNLIIVTNTFSVESAIKNSILSTLQGKKPSLIISHKQHNDYHDRYWISGAREKGLVMGTSLNSLGNKIAIVDRLNTSDVRNIVVELKNDGLL